MLTPVAVLDADLECLHSQKHFECSNQCSEASVVILHFYCHFTSRINEVYAFLYGVNVGLLIILKPVLFTELPL